MTKNKTPYFFLVGFLIAILFLLHRDWQNSEIQKVAVIPTITPTESATPTVEPSPTSELSTPTLIPSPTLVPTPTMDRFTGVNLFNYGAQLNWTNVDNNQEMVWLSGMGFKWAKAQVRWCDFESSPGNFSPGQMDALIAAARAKDIKVLASVVCAPRWSRADGGVGGSGPPDDMTKAAEFMGRLAGRYCAGGVLGAIEVWNEHNLLKEWHGKPISAVLYMELLKRSHAAIKAACPAMIVVSGAPTPTGVMNAEAMDDVVFLQQMYANGLKQYSDAIGAHPSGFCNAPNAVEGAPNLCSGQYNSHRSFFFKRTLEEYRKVMVANGDASKQIWPTEFGWGVDPSPKPGFDYTKYITIEIQARWLVQAYQMMKQMGYIGVAIVWNLDFMDMSSETGAFHVQGRAAQNALAGMAK